LNLNVKFHEVISEILNEIIPKGKGIEVNASGFAYNLGTAMLSADILKLYKDCGGEIITIGSDAHEPNHVAHRFPEIIQQIQQLGFPYLASFTNREPTFHAINKFI